MGEQRRSSSPRVGDPSRINSAAFEYYPPLRRVKSFVDKNYSENLPLSRVARVAGLERSYFSTFFHSKTGVCYRDWLSYKRVVRAARLLSESDRSITSTAFRVGFNDLRTFERAFKKWLGQTPSSYKAQARPD